MTEKTFAEQEKEDEEFDKVFIGLSDKEEYSEGILERLYRQKDIRECCVDKQRLKDIIEKLCEEYNPRISVEVYHLERWNFFKKLKKELGI